MGIKVGGVTGRGFKGNKNLSPCDILRGNSKGEQKGTLAFMGRLETSSSSKTSKSKSKRSEESNFF